MLFFKVQDLIVKMRKIIRKSSSQKDLIEYLLKKPNKKVTPAKAVDAEKRTLIKAMEAMLK